MRNVHSLTKLYSKFLLLLTIEVPNTRNVCMMKKPQLISETSMMINLIKESIPESLAVAC